jgi:hypothetical protein
MQTINLEKIIKDTGVSQKELAEMLFPNNRHADRALNRIKKGRGFLNSQQIGKLAELVEIPISRLFSTSGWVKSLKDKDKYIFYKDSFKAVLDPKTRITKIYCRNSLFYEDIIHSEFTVISDYLERLEEIINNAKNK